jgi:3-mercaptopyruvate sulfurtransferase SseA
MPQRKQQIPTPIFFIAGGLLLIIAAVLLMSPFGSASPTPAASIEEETYPEIPRVSLAEAKAAHDSGAAVFVDVRSLEAYTGGHITGSVNVPSSDIESRINELDPAQWIITYCT